MTTSSNGNIFPRYWPFVRGIHQSPVNFPHKGQWRGAFMVFFYLRLSKQSWGWWFETLLHSLWRHSNGGPVILKAYPCYDVIMSSWLLWMKIMISITYTYSNKMNFTRPSRVFVFVGINFWRIVLQLNFVVNQWFRYPEYLHQRLVSGFGLNSKSMPGPCC